MSIIKKSLTILACTSLISPSIASAHGYGDYITPYASSPITWLGTVTVGKKFLPGDPNYGVILDCEVEVRLKGPDEDGDGVNGSHTDEDHIKARITFTGGGDAGCRILTVNKIHDIELDPVNQRIKFKDVYVNTSAVPGDAEGDIEGELTPGGDLDIPLTILGPGVLGTGDAFVVSVAPLTLTNPGSISIVADDHV